jgi:NAD(P)H-hydrate epimerase
VSFESFARIPQTQRARRLRQSNLLIDALLGTGTRGEIRGHYRDAIEAINQSHRPVVSVDIPSGLDSDQGHPLGIAVKAKVTVTMAAAKTGLLKPVARPYVGRLIVADIGIPHALLS